jgi:hypothetical protein
MTTNLSTRTSAYPRRSKALGLALVSILAVVVLAGIGALPASASNSTGYDNVQVFIHTSQTLPYSYTLTVYNTSGVQVAYYQSNFPAAALELPNGTYLFTVTASYSSPFNNVPCICDRTITGNYTSYTNSTLMTNSTAVNGMLPMLLANSTVVTNSTAITNSTGITVWPIYTLANSTQVTNSTGLTVMPIYTVNDTFTTTIGNSTEVTNSTGVMPILVMAPSSNEYGYALEQITGPSSITINTQNSTSFPTTQVTVHVSYANGTAAQGAWVYASVVDDYYYYYGSNIVSEAQTGADGTAVLTMPQAPLMITSYLSVPITLPQSQSNVTVIIGGQKVNVTVYWQPNSISLEGQTLIMPPQTSGNITLQYQPQQVYYYPIDTGTSSGPLPPGNSVTTTTMTATGSVTSQNKAQGNSPGNIPPFNPANVPVATHVTTPAAPTTTVAAKGTGEESLLLVGGAVVLAVVLAGLAFALVTVRGRRNSSIVSA